MGMFLRVTNRKHERAGLIDLVVDSAKLRTTKIGKCHEDNGEVELYWMVFELYRAETWVRRRDSSRRRVDVWYGCRNWPGISFVEVLRISILQFNLVFLNSSFATSIQNARLEWWEDCETFFRLFGLWNCGWDHLRSSFLMSRRPRSTLQPPQYRTGPCPTRWCPELFEMFSSYHTLEGVLTFETVTLIYKSSKYTDRARTTTVFSSSL